MGKIVSIKEAFKNKRRVRGWVSAYLREKINLLTKAGFGKAIILDSTLINERIILLTLCGLKRKIKEFNCVGTVTYKGNIFLYLKKESGLLPTPKETLPLDPRYHPLPEKNQAAVTLGRLGGLKGGPARAAKLSPERRSEIARQAVNTRWSK